MANYYGPRAGPPGVAGGRPHARRPGRGPDAARRPAERDAGQARPDQRGLRPRPARGADPDARRRPAPHRHPRPAGRAPRPVLLTRTPYDAHALTTCGHSAQLGSTLAGYDNPYDVIVESGYIRVVQDVRGQCGSEGDYVMNRPLRGPQNPTEIDHATDASDTIDWLVRNLPETDGRVGIIGISEVLTEPLKISGEPPANLYASTSGADSDWVVKLIDVYPDQAPGQPGRGGYPLMVSADIFRGRFRESFGTPKALEPDRPLLYRFALPTANHVFLPGHRIMAQVQSSRFPLYDRNPPTFVPNIFWAGPADYRKATQRVYHAPGRASFVERPLVASP